MKTKDLLIACLVLSSAACIGISHAAKVESSHMASKSSAQSTAAQAGAAQQAGGAQQAGSSQQAGGAQQASASHQAGAAQASAAGQPYSQADGAASKAWIESQHQGDRTNYFLIQGAASGQIERMPGHANVYKITLHNVTPYVSYLSDRPNRKAGQISFVEYLNLWMRKGKNSFKANPPNAILHASQYSSSSQAQAAAEPQSQSATSAAGSSSAAAGAAASAMDAQGTIAQNQPLYYAFEIYEPKYDTQSQTLTYHAKPLAGNAAAIPDAMSLQHITLFIDEVCIGCWDD